MAEEVKKTSYKWLAIGVGVTALIAVMAYIWNFWGWPPSQKPSDWADFATYISGTVGVAAVVATLMAFLITLRQQQSLVKSQDEMLKAQREQIKITEKRSLHDEAYKGSFEIFPVLVDVFKEALGNPAKIYVRGKDVENPDNALNCEFSTLHDYFMIGGSENEIAQSIKKPFPIEVDRYGPVQFHPVHEIVEFMNSVSSVDGRLMAVFDYYLSKDLGHGKSGWFYIDCYKEFQIGQHMQHVFPAITRRESKNLIDDLFEKEVTALRWSEIGGKVIDDDWVYLQD